MNLFSHVPYLSCLTMANFMILFYTVGAIFSIAILAREDGSPNLMFVYVDAGTRESYL